MQNPTKAIAELNRLDAEDSLAEFIRQGWKYADPSVYKHNWHIDAICEHLEAVSTGDIKRLLITMPPRHMKSLGVSVFWPAWTWIKRPNLRWLFSSYAHTLSIRDSVKCRRVVDSNWYRGHWGERFSLTSDQNTKIRFENDEGGYRLATSVDGSLTGDGGDIIVVDDPHNVRDADSEAVRAATISWWDEAMSTRLNDPKTGAYVVIMQRIHESDLAGHIIDQGGWEHLCLPARYDPEHPHVWPRDPRAEGDSQLLWPDRYGEEQISALETTLGSYGTAGQLQQLPAPRKGGMFEREWFEIVPEAPEARAVRYWDLAATAEEPGKDPDWTAGLKMTLKDGVYFIEDVQRARKSPQGVERLIKQTAELDGRQTQIAMEQEGGSGGKITIDHYARKVLVGYEFRGKPSTGSKTERARPFSAAAEAGNVKLVKGTWNAAFLDEVGMFPRGKHDDQVDSASGAFNILARPEREIRIRSF